MYSKHRKALEKLYEDRATIQRYLEDEEPDNIYKNEPCKLSKLSLGRNDQTEVQNNIQYQMKLFISPDLEILHGDEIIVTRYGRTLNYTAGEPFIYSSHQEVSLERKGYA
ncbi:ABC transporter ATP-binding protein [Chengkuizengella sp. SCS-71B]|uniref:ABC transporter ATP-binding protein n=1 Tax=Chengkuizengella sp. SCS-71B TaxID=3115290 RepID=UPI0032C2108B